MLSVDMRAFVRVCGLVDDQSQIRGFSWLVVTQRRKDAKEEKEMLLRQVVDHTMYAILDKFLVEVDQQAETHVGQSQIS